SGGRADRHEAEPLAFARRLVTLAERMEHSAAVSDAARLVVDALVDDLALCDRASVVARTGRASPPFSAHTDDVAERLADVTTFLGGTPRLHVTMPASAPARTAYSDVAWRRFLERLTRQGVHAMYAARLGTDRQRIGTVVLYSARADAFDGTSHAIACDYVSIALRHRVEVTNLGTALETRGLIGSAMGILMERRRLSETAAWELLSRASQNHNIRLAEICRRVVESSQR
ncbi:ANTAR domain-containing protein, partial [Marinitenerispora sediminis]